MPVRVRGHLDRARRLTTAAEARRGGPGPPAFVANQDEGGDFGTAASQMNAIEDAIWPDLLESKRTR